MKSLMKNCLMVVLAGLLTGLTLRSLFGAQAVWLFGGLAAALFAANEILRFRCTYQQDVQEVQEVEE